jgi:hypothetical protein
MSDLMSSGGHHHPHHLEPDMDVAHSDTTEVLLTLLSQNKMLGGKIITSLFKSKFFDILNHS